MEWTDQMTGGLKAEFFSNFLYSCISKMEIQRWIKVNIYSLFVWLDAKFMEKIIENYLLKYKILIY